jgi:hypothetical protein
MNDKQGVYFLDENTRNFYLHTLCMFCSSCVIDTPIQQLKTEEDNL